MSIMSANNPNYADIMPILNDVSAYAAAVISNQQFRGLYIQAATSASVTTLDEHDVIIKNPKVGAILWLCYKVPSNAVPPTPPTSVDNAIALSGQTTFAIALSGQSVDYIKLSGL